ncbi:major facilitator superfamily domain-containing protein [Aspergillus floccosus]
MASNDDRYFRKAHIVVAGTLFTFNSALGSLLPSGAQSEIASAFNVVYDIQLVLLNSLYLIGFAIGPLIWGPLSEYRGRRPVLIGTYIGYTAFTLGCALAPNCKALLVFRFLCGANAAAPNAVLGGLYSDIYESPEARGIALGLFMSMTSLGPQIAPILSGFVSAVSWRWAFWVALMLAGVGMLPVLLLPETYAPVLMRRQKYTRGLGEAFHRDDVGGKRSQASFKWTFALVFTRPFVMIVQEPILLFSSLYMVLVHAVLYLFFQAYPIYVFPPAPNTTANRPMMAGSIIAFLVFLWYTSLHSKALAQGKPWASEEEYRRLPRAGGGAPAVVIGLFWLAWTSYKSIHRAVSMLSGVWFGAGYLLIFLAMNNYLTDAYKQNSASAQSAASNVRSAAAVCLTLATDPMYGDLGIHWGMAVIPFVFIRYGVWIRRHSRFCKSAMEEEERRKGREDMSCTDGLERNRTKI